MWFKVSFTFQKTRGQHLPPPGLYTSRRRLETCRPPLKHSGFAGGACFIKRRFTHGAGTAMCEHNIKAAVGLGTRLQHTAVPGARAEHTSPMRGSRAGRRGTVFCKRCPLTPRGPSWSCLVMGSVVRDSTSREPPGSLSKEASRDGPAQPPL